jgi:hypothetical protein
MSSHLEQLEGMNTLDERIAYLMGNPNLIDDLSEVERTEVIGFLKTRLSNPQMGFEASSKDKPRGFGDLASILQEMLTSAGRKEIEQIAIKCGLMD